MGLLANVLNKVFGKSKPDNKLKKINYLDLFTPFFSGVYKPDFNTTYVSGVSTHSRHISKAKPYIKHKDKGLQNGKEYINYLLNNKPNPLMSAPVLWKTLGRNYFMDNIALAYLEWDYDDYKAPLKGIWPLDFDSHSLECRISESGELFVSFTLEGIKRTAGLDDLIILVREVDPSSIFGKRSEAVDSVLKVLQTQYEGVEQAIRTSAFIRFIVTSTTPLSNMQKEEKAKYFANTYLGKDSSGVVYVDQAQQVTKVDSQAKYANAEEMKEFKNDIYCYLGISEKIIKAEYSEDEWQAYYESALEPFFIELEAELTNKILTSDDVRNGYEILIDANRLHSASLKTRKDIALAYMKLPVYKPNVVTDLLFLPTLKNGDKEYATLNYVEADKQNEYQGVSSNNEEEENEPNV
jgi:HK97 family phage portal protein